MEDEKKIEALLDLCKISYQRFQDRRSIEWKINFGIWTALVAFLVLVVTKGPLPLNGYSTAFAIAILILFVAVQFFWLRWALVSEDIDRECHWFYRDKVNEIIGTKAEWDVRILPLITIAENRKLGRYWSVAPSVAVSLILAFASIIFLYSSSDKTDLDSVSLPVKMKPVELELKISTDSAP